MKLQMQRNTRNKVQLNMHRSSSALQNAGQLVVVTLTLLQVWLRQHVVQVTSTRARSSGQLHICAATEHGKQRLSKTAVSCSFMLQYGSQATTMSLAN
jgi:4-hydroxy-3-methylbut-2-enyl diphosphate reductase IspH